MVFVINLRVPLPDAVTAREHRGHAVHTREACASTEHKGEETRGHALKTRLDKQGACPEQGPPRTALPSALCYQAPLVFPAGPPAGPPGRTTE